jgi:serine/threonine protein kinase SCH9
MQAIDPTSRTAAPADEDGGDQIGYETPRSGIATPQPDLQDKRLPGIMSYFGQVRQDPSASITPSFISQAPESAMASGERPCLQSESTLPPDLQSQIPAKTFAPCGVPASVDPLSPVMDESSGRRLDAAPAGQMSSFSCPTPPYSKPGSSDGSHKNGEAQVVPSTVPAKESSEKSDILSQDNHLPSESRPNTSMPDQSTNTFALPLTSEALTSGASSTPTVGAAQSLESLLNSAPCSSSSASAQSAQSSSKWFSIEGLKELTIGAVFKSGPPTPTRALSAALPSHSDGRETPTRRSNDAAETSGTQTPRGPTGAQAPAARGKLTIKIPEGRGLRKSRDPYVVVVFQRSELISSGPRAFEEDENLAVAPIGGIPIQRQASDSGRPPMAIPMRSRQSSNTSTNDPSAFRNRTARASFTNPQWDAEAVL